MLPSIPPLTPSSRIAPSGTLPTYRGCRLARNAPVLVRWQSRVPLKYRRSLLCSLMRPTCVHRLTWTASLEVRRSHRLPMLGMPKHTYGSEEYGQGYVVASETPRAGQYRRAPNAWNNQQSNVSENGRGGRVGGGGALFTKVGRNSEQFIIHVDCRRPRCVFFLMQSARLRTTVGAFGGVTRGVHRAGRREYFLVGL